MKSNRILREGIDQIIEAHFGEEFHREQWESGNKKPAIKELLSLFNKLVKEEIIGKNEREPDLSNIESFKGAIEMNDTAKRLYTDSLFIIRNRNLLRKEQKAKLNSLIE